MQGGKQASGCESLMQQHAVLQKRKRTRPAAFWNSGWSKVSALANPDALPSGGQDKEVGRNSAKPCRQQEVHLGFLVPQVMLMARAIELGGGLVGGDGKRSAGAMVVRRDISSGVQQLQLQLPFLYLCLNSVSDS